MWAGIWGVLSAFPELLSMIKSLVSWLNKISGNDPAGFILKSSAVFQKLNAAQTQAEHADAAKALSDLIANIPPK